MPQAMPTPRPLGAGAGFQPNLRAAAFRTAIIRSSLRFRSRNSSGSEPTAEALPTPLPRRKPLIFTLDFQQAPHPYQTEALRDYMEKLTKKRDAAMDELDQATQGK